MVKYTLILLLAAVFAISLSSAAYISNIVLDATHGQILVTADDILYELDNSEVKQNAVHRTPGTPAYNALFVGKHGNKQALYAYLDTPTGQEFAFFPLPLKNQQTLKVQKETNLPPGLSQPSTFDSTDQVAILSLSRNLTLVNLNSLAALDSIRYYQNRQFGVNLIYNHNNNRLSVFSTYFPIGTPSYGLSVDEYDLSNNRFQEIDSTYNCLCEGNHNASASPFYEVEFVDGNCQIDYSVHPARIWCPRAGTDTTAPQLFSFNANNLSDFTVCNLEAALDAATFDFTNRFAYAIYANGADYTTQSFAVSKVSLDNCALLSTYSNALYTIDPTIFQLDVQEHHLYLAVYSDNTDAPTQIISVNTNTMRNDKVVTLNSNGL